MYIVYIGMVETTLIGQKGWLVLGVKDGDVSTELPPARTLIKPHPPSPSYPVWE